MVTINNLTKKFGRMTALNEISFNFENKVYGLLGPNGAGKTTLMRCLTSIYKTRKGTINFNNANENIGYLPQKFGMFKDLTVKEMMEYFANLKKLDAKEEIQKVVEIVNLSDRINDKIGQLSGGMIRRLGIAQAILGNPSIVIFDEPTAGLDPEERLRFKNILMEIRKEMTIILSTHIVEDVESVCDEIVIIDSGLIKQSGNRQNIANLAQGKVYEVSQQQLDGINVPYFIEKQYEREGINTYRVITKHQLDYCPVNPTVEDGYIYTIKGF